MKDRTVEKNEHTEAVFPTSSQTRRRLQQLFREAKRHPEGVLSLLVVVGIFLVAVFAPYLAPYDPRALQAGPRLEGPSVSHPFGTDRLGRDQLSRVIDGARTALVISLSSIALGVVAGTLMGLSSGWFLGWVEQLVQRFVDAIMAIPALVMAMALVAVLGTSRVNLVIALATFQLPTAARTVHGTVLAARQEMYVEAATAIGASNWRTLFRHVLPNIFAPILIVVTAQLGSVIIGEAALSFVGLGIQPPEISWGHLLSEARSEMEAAPWLVAFPASAVALTVLAFNFLGDALRDILDPKLRGGR
jgi:ABC-type dipeptide/oligopeptide/nickel transport system permease subunit